MSGFKRVEYEGFENAPDMRGIVEKTLPFLEEEVGRTAPWVEVFWKHWKDEQDRSHLKLTLHDLMNGGEASDGFAPHALQPAESARRRFTRLWGDVLQSGFQLRFGALEAKVGALSED